MTPGLGCPKPGRKHRPLRASAGVSHHEPGRTPLPGRNEAGNEGGASFRCPLMALYVAVLFSPMAVHPPA
jgi:hypothetical protein